MTIASCLLTIALAAAAVQQAPSGLAFNPPRAWQPRPAASSMRVAEFVVPRASGDTEDGEAIVYYFGGGGGSVEANIDRWIGQMEQPNGAGSKDKATRTQQLVNGLKVTLVDVSGTYVAEMQPGSAQRHNKPGFRLRAAVVETPRGPYYIKMTGPARTIAAADADFKAFIASLKPSTPQ